MLPAPTYLKQYRECLKEREKLRDSLSVGSNEKEDSKFCKKYYKLYVAKLITDLM